MKKVKLLTCIEGINRRALSHVAHRSITKEEAVASVSPVFSLVEGVVVVVHLFHQLAVSARALVDPIRLASLSDAAH